MGTGLSIIDRANRKANTEGSGCPLGKKGLSFGGVELVLKAIQNLY